MARPYELIFSLGNACSCSLSLRKAELQYASFPFDWMIRGTFLQRAEILAAGLPEWPGRLENLEIMAGKSNTEHLMCRDRSTDLLFPHDFPLDRSIAESYAAVVAKYRRRTERLLRLLRNPGRVLIVYVEMPGFLATPKEVLLKGLTKIRNAYPSATIELLYFSHVPNVAFVDRVIDHPATGVTCINFDYKERTEGAFIYGADPELIAAALRAEAVRVRDYRTPAERAAYRKSARAAQYEAMKANSWLSYIVTRLEYKIWHHLARKLTKKGVQLDR